MQKRFLCILIILTASLDAGAQTPVKLTLTDRSQIHCTLVAESLPFHTPYGTLTFPVADITRIRFGSHVLPSEQKQLDSAAKALGSALHREREDAAKTLREIGRPAIPRLRALARSVDLEIAKRAGTLLADLIDDDPREVHDHDLLTTRRFAIEGTVAREELTFRSTTLGEFKVALGRIDSIAVYSKSAATFAIDAAKYGDAWMPTGVMLHAGEAVSIKASGAVDLWPQQAGQYLAAPRGHSTTGKGGQYLAGALIGKIGDGPVVLIGEGATIEVRVSGELMLQIVSSPWNNVSSGQYDVTVKAGR